MSLLSDGINLHLTDDEYLNLIDSLSDYAFKLLHQCMQTGDPMSGIRANECFNLYDKARATYRETLKDD